MECIILAGGLGTRLSGVIGSLPKCMAAVAGKPFLHHLFEYLGSQQCRRIVLSLGFRHEQVIDWLDQHQWPFAIDYVIEKEPLGTGGGIALAAAEIAADDFVVVNGDTMFRVDLPLIMNHHREKAAAATIALKEMHHFDRYGVVVTDDNGCIRSFEEKQYRDQGMINGGIYILNREALTRKPLPERFSFEKDYLEQYVGEGRFYGCRSDAYFIDIGVPEDYSRAQADFQ